MSTIYFFVYYIKIYVKKLPDIMVFTPFHPTSYHSNPLCSVLIDLLCGRDKNRVLMHIFLSNIVHTSSPRRLFGHHASLDLVGGS